MSEASVLSVMGGSRALGAKVRSALDLADLIERGVPRAAAERVRERLDLTEHEFAQVLGVSAKTLQRLGRDAHARLTPALGDRLYRMARLVAFAEEVFEDRARARDWLRQPQRGLGSRTPLALMRTEAGAREVEDLLGRIEYGVFS
jgi:putative toxin-antitoxin system antitoxin component (TIGR02293 family)